MVNLDKFWLLKFFNGLKLVTVQMLVGSGGSKTGRAKETFSSTGAEPASFKVFAKRSRPTTTLSLLGFCALVEVHYTAISALAEPLSISVNCIF